MAVLYSNNASTTLSASITNSATSLTVAAGKGALFPAISGSDYFYITLVSASGVIEIMKVTARSADVFTVTRGQDGTTAVAWAAGDRVELRFNKALLDDVKAALVSGATFADWNVANPNLAQLISTSTNGVNGVTNYVGMHFPHASLNYGFQIAGRNDSAYYRTLENGTYTAWRAIAHSATQLYTFPVLDNNLNLDSGQQDKVWATNIGTATDRGTKPANYAFVVNLGGRAASGLQIAASYGGSDNFYVRRGSDNGGSVNGANAWQPWYTLLHSGNYSSYAAAASHTHSYLPLSGGTLTGKVFAGSSDGDSFEVRNDTASAASSGYITFKNKNSSGVYRPAARISGVHVDNAFDGDFLIETYSGGVAYKGLRVDENSNVLLYDTSGNVKFQWEAVNSRALINDNVVLHAGNVSSYALPLSGGTLTGQTIFNSGAVFFNDGSSRAMYLKGSGNIIQFCDADGTFRWENVGRNGTYYIYKGYGTGSGYKFQIDDSGNITINNGSGSTNVSGTLNVSADNVALALTGAQSRISFRDADLQWTGYVGFSGNTGQLSFPGRNVEINSAWNGQITLNTGASGYNSGTVAIPYGNLTVQGNTALHAGNFSSYALPNPGSGTGGRVLVNLSGNPSWSDASFTYDPIMGQFRATNFRANVGDAAPTWNFNAILHAGNYTSYSPSLSSFANAVQGDGTRGRSTYSSSMDSLSDPSGFYFYPNPTGSPTGEWTTWINAIGNAWSAPDGYGFQLANSFWNDSLWVRRLQSGAWQTWRRILHSGNFTDYTGQYVLKSGDTMNGHLTMTGGASVRVFFDGSSSITSQLYFANNNNSRAWNWQLDENNNAALWGYNGSGWTKKLTATQDGYLLAGGKYLADGWLHSDRDFVDGTLIQTDIDYSVTNGDPFVLEIRGNSYGSQIPFDIQYQGYIYADTIINHGGYSNGTNITGLVAINYNGNLCFWFPRQSYWHGFYVRAYSAYATYPRQRVFSISNSGKPTTAKQVDLSANIRQSLHSGNYSSYALPLSGGASMSGPIQWGPQGDNVNGSAWYGIGQNNGDLYGSGGNTMQVAGYYGLRLRSASAILDIYMGSAYFNSTFNAATLQNSGYQVLHAGNYTDYVPISTDGGANKVLKTASNGYLYLNNWMHVGGGGLFSSNNSAHWYPADGSYGAWKMSGSRNGWSGIAFGGLSNGEVTLMVNPNSNETGFHNQSYGWQILWSGGTLYNYKNSYGGGTQAAVLDSSNYSGYALPLSGGTVTGIITTVSSGTAINFSGQSDSFGYNATSGLGTYIKGTGNTYLYGGGSFYDGSTQRALLHAGNYTSYAASASHAHSSLTEGNRTFSAAGAHWGAQSNTTSYGGIQLRDSGNTIKGYLYWENSSSAIGITNFSGTWIIKANNTAGYAGGVLYGPWVVASSSTTTSFGIFTANSTSTDWNAGFNNTYSGTQNFLRFLYATSQIGSVVGSNTSVTYNTSSDYRLKNITGPVTAAEAKAFVMALEPEQGTWLADGSKFVGFVAHKFQQVSPSSVTGVKDAVDAQGKPIYQAMQAASSEVMANLIALVQAQQLAIEELTNRLNQLQPQP